jgi:hypothetical protein
LTPSSTLSKSMNTAMRVLRVVVVSVVLFMWSAARSYRTSHPAAAGLGIPEDFSSTAAQGAQWRR